MGSGAGWSNPAFGGTTLRIPAVQSPNFSLTEQTGWAIYADGTAYFFNVTVSGTITGGTLVIDGPNGGVFVYSGTPGNGNLIGSWAGQAGTDTYGNAYPEGLNVTVGSISGTVFSGTDFEINSDGAFFYSGTPASGNLVISISQSSGTDSYGNAYKQGVTSYETSSAASLFTTSGYAGLIFHQLLSSTVTVAPQIFGETSNSGAADEIAVLVLTSGKESGNSDAALQLFSESADGTVPARGVFEFGGTIAVTVTPEGAVFAGQSSAPAASSGSATPYATSSGALAVVDGTDSQVYATQRRTLSLSSTTATLTSLTTILSSAVGARTYRLHAVLYVTAAATGAEFTCEVNLPSGATGQLGYTIARATTFVAQVSGGPNSSVGAAVSLTSGDTYTVFLDGLFTVTASGTLEFQAGSLTSDGLTVNQFSFIEIMPV